ncbi:MAG: Rho termination factor N-terminal domain-containing protein [Oculatellaceae cyanobacterium Prado106]|jgi:hypothetical protein|nr:Rho termination factor N-terminal domain-containing protein [Oculatellaceae cyanobacterium Prado106]
MGMAIAFLHFLHVHPFPTITKVMFLPSSECVSSEIIDSPEPQLEMSLNLSLPYPLDVLIPVTFILISLLQSQTLVQLRSLAKELDLSGYSGLSKATLVKVIVWEQQRQCFRYAEQT